MRIQLGEFGVCLEKLSAFEPPNRHFHDSRKEFELGCLDKEHERGKTPAKHELNFIGVGNGLQLLIAAI